MSNLREPQIDLVRLRRIVDQLPLVEGGSNVRTKKVIQEGENLLKIIAAPWLKILAIFITVVPLVGILAVLYFQSIGQLLHIQIEAILFPIILPLCGLFILHKLGRTLSISKDYGYLWNGSKNPRQIIEPDNDDDFIPFANIAALQLLEEKIEGDENNYSSFELNLISINGSRLNLMDHSNLAAISKEASLIADFIEVPIWDEVLK